MRRGERGQSVTVFFAVAVTALFLVTGLVVDGGRQASAAREAQGVAAAAARAGSDAAGSADVAGGARDAGLAAARRSLEASGMTGTVTMLPTGVRVKTETTVDTVFLSLIGIRTLRAEGVATSDYSTVT